LVENARILKSGEGEMGRAKKIKGKASFNDFVMFGRNMLHNCPEWKGLHPAAKILYLYIKARFNGSNNGEICLSYRWLKGIKGLSSPSTISKAFGELEKGNWIRRRSMGGMFRRVNKYELTGTHDSYITFNRSGMARYK